MFGPIWQFFFQSQSLVSTPKRLRIGKRRIVEKVRT